MQRICPVCETANRPNARYCRKCATPLPTDEAPYAQTQIFVPSESFDPDGTSPAAQPTRPIELDEPGASARKAQRRVLAGFVVATLVLGMAFWWKQRSDNTPAPVAEPVLASAPAPMPAVVEPTPAPPPRPPASTEAAQAAPVQPVQPAQSAQSAQPAPPPRRVAPARPRARASAPAPVPIAPTPAPAPAPPPVAPAPAAVVVPPPPAAPPPPASPSQACADRGFFTRTACIAEQCETPRFNRHPQCVQLREDQRRETEIRQSGG